MSEPIDFYFDFASPYGYLASERIDALAERFGRTVTWRPVLLGATFKVTGLAPLTSYPLKGEYVVRDAARAARFLGLPYRHPESFPIATHQAARAYYWLADRDAKIARAFAHCCYRAYFCEGIDIGDVQRLAVIADSLGLDAQAFTQALADPQVKDRLRAENEHAIARGVFGSPFVIVDGEPFWGADRFPHLERWLETGGY